MTYIRLLNGQELQTSIPLDEVYVLFKQVVQGRARIVIQAFHEGKERGVDLRRLDPEATFIADEGSDGRQSGTIVLNEGGLKAS